MKTIPRNHKRRIEEIKAKAVRCVVFGQGNSFIATACDPAYAWKELYAYDFARLIEFEDKWTVEIHSNLWYELRTAK